jgi:hypothetical protein
LSSILIALSLCCGRVVKIDQVAEQLDVLDYTVNAITLGIQADARRQVIFKYVFLL